MPITQYMREPISANLHQSKLMADTLRATLEVLNPLGVEIVLNMMNRACGVMCSEQKCSSKEEIEQGLIYALGRDAGQLVIREWDKKMSRTAST